MGRKILIRFDDICPTMNYEQWNKADEILQKYKIKPLLGIIPECKDPELQIEDAHQDFWDYMKKLQKRGYTLAMHGCFHLYDTNSRGIVNGGNRSEFAGHSYEIQYKKIAYGKKKLEEHGISTDIFFAPSHSYDKNTLKALAANGFRYISDGKSRKAFIRNGIICIPCRFGGCPGIRKNGYYTAVFHAHEWVRADKVYGYEELINLCDKCHEDIVSFDEYVKRKTGSYIGQLCEEKIYLFWIDKMKPILRKFKLWMVK